MTLEPYTPERLDALALRFFDISAKLREMSKTAREAGVEEIPLHDKKAIEWCDNLEIWLQKSQNSFDLALLQRK